MLCVYGQAHQPRDRGQRTPDASWRHRETASVTSAALTLEEELVDGVVVLAVGGGIDRATALALSDALRRATSRRTESVLVDLCGVTSVGSAAIAVLLNALRRLAHQSRRLLLACPPGEVLSVFEVNGLIEIFTIFPTRDEALAQADM